MVKNTMQTEYIISTVVENKSGVLYRACNVFRQRGYNIKSITVGELDDKTMSRMTFTIDAKEDEVRQLVKVMEKQVDVVNAKILDHKKTIKKELALIKINVDTPDKIPEIRAISNIGTIIEETLNNIMVEITGTSEKIDEFMKAASKFGKIEVARTGTTALESGKENE